MTHIVFDIGGVLVDWQPHLAWTDVMTETEAHEFLDRTGFKARNTRADGGAKFADLAGELEDLQDATLFAQYVDRYARTVQQAKFETWDILDRLLAGGIPCHAITNWSAETWPEGLKVHPRLDEVFGTLIVSGREGMMKPEREIFDLLCVRAGVDAGDCVFVDDGMHNVNAAKSVGRDGIHFANAAMLERDLSERGLI